METRQCENCGETVDAAKAFCPGCGNAFVEEKAREKASEFESHDSTVQMGQTMYNQMLSDMGLNIKKSPAKPEAEAVPKKVEVAAPVAPAAAAPVELKPAAPSPVELKPAAPPPATHPNTQAKQPATGSNKWIWIMVAGLVLIFLFAALIVAAGIGFYIFTAR
ncbi:MAG: hypothetical protein IPM50_07380 [Acidobacteriota bacterium]|nr:MAG: hypothetical protein IPM50_07380 [Acidobacteriota bacterium]